ncbi:hypothetical protein GCM10010123_35920 [Pilimelia anulata]|uniref:histidine kinase n=1 Tax=Pilimelia anulata TaxID=53371 RepID=A0A8J3BEH4_9ACTN|nr:ATP-binding protein [Pilimelia anulata]GGK02768.1 hypothetical protein GCM10010123_35920 [Pilimelia anulata]
MGRPPTVGRLLRRAFGVLVTLVGLAGIAGITTALVQQDTVRDLTGHVGPSRTANLQLRIVMLDAQRSVRGYFLSGGTPLLASYEGARTAYEPTVHHLRVVAGAEHAAEVAEQDRLARRWWDFVAAQLTRPVGSAGVRAQVPSGQALFDEFTAANDRLERQLDDENRDLAARATGISIGRLAGTVLVVAAAAALAWYVARRTTVRIVRPLGELSGVLAELGGGDPDARVRARSDVVELAAVAEATNAMAEEAARTRRLQEGMYQQERRLVDNLRQLERARNGFMSTVSHELRTPLTNIVGYLETLRDAGDLTARQDRTVAVLERNTDRLQALVDDLLVLSQMESGTLTTRPQPVDMAALVNAGIDAIRPAAEAARLTLDATVGGPTVASADAGQLSRAIAHVLNNAVKFTPAGGRVTVTVSTERDVITIRVSDTGIGIPAEDQTRLFAPFFRARNAVDRAVQGSGLGLVIVRTIVVRHGGAVAIESAPDRGTSVALTLPAAAPDGGADGGG